MTSRRQRKINRASSLLGLLRAARAEKTMTSPLDAARWAPGVYWSSPWDDVVWPPRQVRRDLKIELNRALQEALERRAD
jgi:hypothetical protein